MSFSHDLMRELLIKADELDGGFQVDPNDFIDDYREADVWDTAIALAKDGRYVESLFEPDMSGNVLICFQRLTLEGADFKKQFENEKTFNQFKNWLKEQGLSFSMSTAQLLFNAWITQRFNL